MSCHDLLDDDGLVCPAVAEHNRNYAQEGIQYDSADLKEWRHDGRVSGMDPAGLEEASDQSLFRHQVISSSHGRVEETF